jgi:integrase
VGSVVRYLDSIHPATKVPPHGVVGARYQRPAPCLWEEAEILGLMEAAGEAQPAPRALTCEKLFGLLWATGMGIGEVISLEWTDVDLSTGILLVCVAPGPVLPRAKSPVIFVSSVGITFLPQLVGSIFDKITTANGHRAVPATPYPIRRSCFRAGSSRQRLVIAFHVVPTCSVSTVSRCDPLGAGSSVRSYR